MIHNDWPWDRVKEELHGRGTTLFDLSRQHDRDPGYLHMAKKVPLPKAQQIIAEFLNLEPWDIWPSRYTRDHKPVSRLAWLNASKKQAESLVQKAGAE